MQSPIETKLLSPCFQGCLKTAKELLKTMDKTVDPCQDFYLYACGNFIKNTKIPDDAPMYWYSISPIADLIGSQVFVVLLEIWEWANIHSHSWGRCWRKLWVKMSRNLTRWQSGRIKHAWTLRSLRFFSSSKAFILFSAYWIGTLKTGAGKTWRVASYSRG